MKNLVTDDRRSPTRRRRLTWLVLSLSLAFVLVLGAVAAFACAAARPRPAGAVLPLQTYRVPARPTCERATVPPTSVGDLDQLGLPEASGIVASLMNPGVLWMHNDSGDRAQVFAVSEQGQSLGTLALPDVDAVDFEDIATGPCPDLMSPCLFLADTGDNKRKRESLAVYAVREPVVSAQAPLADDARAEMIWRLPFTIPDGPANIEAFVVLPDASAMVFFEKQAVGARILRYPAPWQIDVTTNVEITDTFDAPGPVEAPAALRVVTGADLHPSGTRLLLRTYLGVYEARLDALQGKTIHHVSAADFRELFAGPDDEPQGEAVAYDQDGTGIWTVSERPKDARGQPLHHARCE